ncbi:GNAT family N-acetyltransferase [Cryobacterium sp. PAMC25264]|uniref:GNAT family N-acetyltransferase n=1 Tax=Cryobacterium sp. PAMC25264 TaxID=2861288 RepID=UPI001C63B743|nr:GNAT family N-acetyltransferase [Cryobacterium sp. PAMC25264]QYF74213.1 GNAT family N-acetyltransferase [Cryobacterium sp. PAMC25264]
MLQLTPTTSRDLEELTEFLRGVDLTLSGLASPAVRLWITRDASTGCIVASTGFECSDDGSQVLIRSVAVDPSRRGRGTGLELAGFALDKAAEAGAERAWLFSRRSGEFWQRLGFALASTGDLAAALARTHQVRHFAETGQLAREVAWSRRLS